MLEALKFPLTGNLGQDVQNFLIQHNCPKTAKHSADVAAEARHVAALVGADEDKAEAGGWLHDISAIFPAKDRLNIALGLKIDVISEEKHFPLILHQKISVIISKEIFNIFDEQVLSGIGCHTTLKRDASLLDKVIFVADKIAWDQPGEPPYLDQLQTALHISLDEAALIYLQYLWDMRDKLRVIHPWMKEAYLQLSQGE